ncbi:cell division protein ZapA [Sphingobacterium sp. SRCM116780]|uniref:cell division protein ZapA n=1 Tax=Sphingobacterium sp. SRCM116780 TaxID=2907623 RepID=UPI001F41080F|nr:cell division protein ZapA [Sphingobacterium sp. SRCM116780]UIR54570.1 cell division protein ZapA [Sphingobacterium sp. SRCM116780]
MGEISIKINIADRVYPLRVDTSEEEIIRHAAKLINEKVKELQDNYTVRDKQDLLSMCVLQYATGMLKAERQVQTQDQGVEQSVHELDQLLSNFFTK